MDTKGGGWSVGAAGPVQQPDCVGVGSGGGTALANADCAQFVFPLYSFLFSHL